MAEGDPDMTGSISQATSIAPPPPFVRPRRGITLPRDRTPLGLWFWEIDRVLLFLISILIAIGLVAVAAASPVASQTLSTDRVSLDPLYYFYRQLLWVGLGVPVMLVISMLPRMQARRLAIYLAILFTILLIMVPLVGTTVNGATRWLGSGIFRFQPSEFLKPAFVVSLAWLLSLRSKDRTLPVIPISASLTAFISFLLMNQPDLGQTVIFCSAWLSLMLLAGMSARWISFLVGVGVSGLVAAYLFYPVATQRINTWLLGQGDAYQVESARTAITGGGLLGVGPGSGVAKFRLPEAHTDYIFSVIGEEFGLLACIAIACVYLAIIVRVFLKLLDEEDNFIILATAGLATQFGLQAIINMGVNTQIFPSKGMTLPFISYGGSSMIALCIGIGLLLAFTRRNPYLVRSPYVVKWSGR
ncbi:putative lipid II flippase FtsW [Rhizorhapis sp. SPR117]|uniref:FtsW/RodA/SpoVE family cell cycle protein n=2 Tax=Rhizorhapis sp. SPR117 TaxID=2912611 RepID=UPI001F1EF73F|nr:putative lipid II flippase FtsW [Rhizorhapis sp. SPR117]